MSRAFALTGARIFDGAQVHADRALVIEDGRVAALVPLADAPRTRMDMDGLTLAPGLIDWQVNGGGGVLFNADPTPDGAASIARAHLAHGTTALLPTLITDRPDVTRAALAAIAAALAGGVPGVVGGHFEGPHLSVARKGAHDPALIRPMTAADVAALGGPGLGSVVATLAPESAGAADIAALAAAGVVVSLGHSDCGYDAAMAAFAAGARAVTHLFNAMSPLGHREPGLVGAALDHPDIWVGVIADGFHVHPAALRMALAAKAGRATLVSDAMPTAGWDGDRFMLNGRAVRREGGRLTLSDGTLAGSDLTLAQAVRHAVRDVGIPLAQALRMASTLPAAMLGLSVDRGALTPGMRADIVAFDADLRVRGVWLGGERVEGAG